MDYYKIKDRDKDCVSITVENWLHIHRKKVEKYFRKLTDDEWTILTEKVDDWVPNTPEEWRYEFESYMMNDNGYNDFKNDLYRILESEVQ